ncbi:hypothetical protein ECG_02234 [Echinococcus granulosus]|uniref:STARP-like antigen n=1 Tax=Echinococcus granulosus TaxID=6210 RepID=A0A068WXV7_ECHGR|nr:hypothetical protein ECG_02234 [Echinococcus granulosus]CDS24976.1 STARP-like antigen [Echinococcus granulosus]
MGLTCVAAKLANRAALEVLTHIPTLAVTEMFVYSPKSLGGASRSRCRQYTNLQQAAVLRRARSSVRMKKAEILNFCYEVLRGVGNLLEENPDVKGRLQSIHSSFCRGLVPTNFPASASTVSTSQATSGDSGVHELHAVTSTSVVRSFSVDYSSIDPTDCSVQPKKSKEIWRPYLDCLYL